MLFGRNKEKSRSKPPETEADWLKKAGVAQEDMASFLREVNKLMTRGISFDNDRQMRRDAQVVALLKSVYSVRDKLNAELASTIIEKHEAINKLMGIQRFKELYSLVDQISSELHYHPEMSSHQFEALMAIGVELVNSTDPDCPVEQQMHHLSGYNELIRKIQTLVENHYQN